jgi:hypothetical protein
MLATLRLSVIALFAALSLGSAVAKDDRLIGTWRSDEGEAVEEYAFRQDHTFMSWVQAKGAVLHTPGVIIETGIWKRDGDRLRIEPKKTNSTKPRAPFTLLILRMSEDRMIAKELGRKKSGTLRRLDLPSCASAPEGKLDPAAVEPQLVGTWKIHLNTHDYEMIFRADRTFAATAQVEGHQVDVPSGTWRLDGDKLIVELEKEKEDDEQSGFRWTIVGFERDCVALRYGTMQLALGRLK